MHRLLAINPIRKRFKTSVLAFFLLSALSGPIRAADDAVNIKLLVVNPSEKKQLATEISHTLPAEIQPEHILDKAEMEMSYDKDKNAYVLTKKVILEPKEARTIYVKVKNVWVIPDETMAQVREQVTQNLKALEGTKFYETAKLLHEKALTRLDQIEAEKSAPNLSIRRRIELYRAHMQQLPEIQSGILSMDSLHKMEATEGQEERTVSFLVTAENPSEQPRKMTIRTELPSDIKSNDVIDKQDFVLLFDDIKECFVVEKQDDFGAKEVKKYTIVLRDIWYIPQDELIRLREQTQKVLEVFQKSAYVAFAQEGADYINSNVLEIEESQASLNEASTVNDRIRNFVLNSQKFKLAKQKLQELKDLLLELPLKSEENIIQKILRGVAQIQKIDDVTKVLSMGIDPEVSTTWWIIFAIIIFLAIMAISFYVTWLVKLNKNTTKQNPPPK